MLYLWLIKEKIFMKKLIIGLFGLFTMNLSGQEMNNIQGIVESLFIATDQKDWNRVEQCFSPEVVLDYSSMTGQPPAVITPQQIVQSWKSILPGFEHTHHQLGNFMIEDKGETATVFCYGTASHYLENQNENIWMVIGTYDFELMRTKSEWRITKMRFNYKFQSGNLSLPELAINKLANKKPELSTGEKNKEVVRQFFKTIEDGDVDKLVNMFAKEGVHVNPYHSGIFPTGAKGREEIRTYWEPVFPSFDGMEFLIEELYSMENPNMIYVKYKGIIKLKNNEGYYRNNYYSTFKFNEDGEINEYVEIFNPVVAARGFGLLNKIK